MGEHLDAQAEEDPVADPAGVEELRVGRKPGAEGETKEDDSVGSHAANVALHGGVDDGADDGGLKVREYRRAENAEHGEQGPEPEGLYVAGQPHDHGVVVRGP